MAERKPCVKCERMIDGWARICPFCNWNQAEPVPARPMEPPVEVAEYKPPQERDIRKIGLIAGTGVLVLIVAFLVGMIINRDGAPKHAPEAVTDGEEEAVVPAPRRADTQLVPMNEPGGFEQPITSAPVVPQPGQVASSQWDRSDATAVSAAEYTQLARRAQAERKQNAPLVDPRSLTGAAYAQGATRSSAARRVASARTRPVPQYQPVPRMRASGSARLDLTIGPDGRVRTISVRKALRGNNAALIGAVQKWRFRPATQNGQPVSAPYSVEISFERR